MCVNRFSVGGILEVRFLSVVRLCGVDEVASNRILFSEVRLLMVFVD